jgi:hypothetical protein
MNSTNNYKTNMRSKIKLIKTRNQKFKKTCLKLYSRNIQYGGGPPGKLSDDVKPIVNVIDFDIEIDKNNKLIDEYLTELNSLHTIITKETPDISKVEFDKFAKELKLKEESILAQKEKIKTQIDELKNQNLENTQQYNTTLQALEQQNAELNLTIQNIQKENTTLQQQLTNSSNSSQTNVLALQQLQKENKEYETKIANITTLQAQLVQLQNEKTDLSKITAARETDINNLSQKLEFFNNSLQEQTNLKNQLQSENITLKQENANLPEKIKSGLRESLQSYDKKLIGHVKQKENVQMGGRRLKKMQESCKIFDNRKKYERNIRKLSKIYNKICILKNSVINKHVKIYVKKNNIKMTDIKKELKFLFENRSKYLNNQTIFMGGGISSPEVYNQVVAHLIDQTPLPDEHFDNIYNQLKKIVKGEVSGESSGKDILDQVYKAVLGNDYDINNTNQQKFLNKAMTIKMLGKEIIDLLTDCNPTGMDIKFNSSNDAITKKAKILDKLTDLIKNGDDVIRGKASKYLRIDSPVQLSGQLNNDINQIYTYYNKEIIKYISPLPEMMDKLKILLKEPWENEDNKDIKQKICKQISILETSFRQINRELDLSYIINKYEDISGAVRVYVRINDYAVNINETEQYECSADSLCLGRSYTIEKVNNEESTFILARNPCEQDAFYNINQKKESIKKGKQGQSSTYTIIDEKLLEKYGMVDVQRYGGFFGTYENVSNKDIFEGIETKQNNPALRDALLQSTQGYSIVLFGYGYSGSGKSYTLLNGKNSMLSSFMSEAKKIGVNISISKISELYGRFDIQNQEMKAKEYEITNDELYELNQEINFADLNNTKKKIREKQINTLLSTIEKLRKNPRIPMGSDEKIPATVKGTPNNPASSRSHLFITLRVRTKDGTEGYLTLVDMAGIENPIEIAVNIFPFYDLRNLVNPFKNVDPQWASINISEFTSPEIAKKKLLDYFGEVCYDFQKVEREVCTPFKDKYATAIINSKGTTGKKGDRDWKMITDCDDHNLKTYEYHTIESGDISSYEDLIEPITFRWNRKHNKYGKWGEVNWSTERKIKQMYEIQENILTSGEAFTLLKEAKEAFYYSGMHCKYDGRDVNCIDRDVISSIHTVLLRWSNNLTENSNPWKYIQNLLKLKVKKKGKIIWKTTGKEKYTLLMNYCFGCMILNGIIKDYNDIEGGIITYGKNENGEVVKKYLKGFLNGVEISATEYNQLVEEGIFINETINHLAYYFKRKNNPNTELKEDDQLKELYTRFDATQVLPRSSFKRETTESYKKSPWDNKISLSLKTYLPNKFLYNPERLNKNVLIKEILNNLDEKSQEGKPSKFIMMCLLRPEIDAKYCTGARATLEFAQSVCSTCT